MHFGKWFSRSYPHFDTIASQVLFQRADLHLLGVEDGRRQPGIYGGVIAEQLHKVVHLTCAARGNDGHRAPRGHGVQQLQIEAVLHAVGIDGVDHQLTCTVFDALLQPIQRIDAGVLAPAFGKQHKFAVHTFNIGGKHHALVAVFLRCRRDDARVADGAGVYADLVGTAFQHTVEVVQRVDAAAHRQRDKDLAGNFPQNIGEQAAALNAGGDVVKHQLVCAGCVVVARHFDRGGHVLQEISAGQVSIVEPA